MPVVEQWANGHLISRTDNRTLLQAQAERLALLADYRWQRETGGTTLGGIPLATDDRSKGLITAASDAARRGDQTSFTFKDTAGIFHTIDAQTMIAIDNGVRAFVQACFAQEAALAAQINAAATNQAVDAIDYTAGF